MATYVRVPGPKREYQNAETGEIISRRQYLKQKRGGITNEEYARMSRITNQSISELRPARGRASGLNKSEVEKEMIAQARIEDRLRKAEIAAEQKVDRDLQRILDRKRNAKRKKVKHLSTRILKAGHMGARVPFYSYEDYVKLFNEGKSDRNVAAYGLGINGFDSSTGEERSITVFTLRDYSRIISASDFYDTMNEEIESRSYFEFTNFYMHVAFKVEFVRQRKEAQQSRKPKSRRGR